MITDTPEATKSDVESLGEATPECTPTDVRSAGLSSKNPVYSEDIANNPGLRETPGKQTDGFQAEITPLESPRRKRGDRTDGWRITFIPNPSSIEPVFRFKRLLKFALRACELRAVDIEQPAEPAVASEP